MKVGFFVPEKGVMVEVEKVDFSREHGVIAAAQMTALWRTGKHRLPSPYWCMWEGKDISVFPLSGVAPSEDVLNFAKAAAFWNQ